MSDPQSRKRTGIWRRPIDKVREINRRYATPRIHMSRTVKISLIILRLYLIGMVLILLYRFITLLR